MAIPKGGSFNHHHHHHHPAQHPTQHPGGHVPYNPPGGGGSGGGSHPTQHPGGHVPYNPPGGHRVAWVVRRQQLLRRAGFNIPVDGIYGTSTEAAWNRFLSGITGGTAALLHQAQASAGLVVPPGYVRYQGRVIPKQQATILGAIAKTRDIPRQFAGAIPKESAAKAGALAQRRARNQQLEQAIARNPSLRAMATAHGGKGADLAALANHRHQQTAAVERRIVETQARDQEALDRKTELDRIIGVDGKWIRLDPDYLVKAARYGRITAHDINVLINNGLLSDTDKGDVMTIQYTLNHELPDHKIKVDGVYGPTTNAALSFLRERAARQEFNKQVQETRKTLYDTGIAQIASQEVLGKVVKAEVLLRILQTKGSPVGAKLSKSLAHYYHDWQSRQAVAELQEQKAQAMLGAGANVKLDHDAVFGILTGPSATAESRSLAFSRNIEEFQGSLNELYAAKLARVRTQQRLEEAARKYMASPHGVTGYFSEATDFIVDTYYRGTPIDNVVEAAGAIYGPLQYNFQRLVLSGYEQYQHYTNLGHLNPLNPPDGAKSVGQAWEDSDQTLSEIHAHGGIYALLFDLIVDPVNFVPGAWYAKGFGLVGHGIAEGVAHGSEGFARSLEFVDRWSTHSKLADGLVAPAYHSHVFAQDVHLLGLRGALREGDRFGALYATELAVKRNRIYRMATTVRADAIRRVHSKMLDLMVTGLRDVSFDRLSVRGADVELAAHAEEFHAIRGLALDDYRVEHSKTAAQQIEAFRRAAPELAASIDAMQSPMFRRAPGFMSSKLTFAGIRVRAHILEGARQAIISRYRLLSDFAEDADSEVAGLQRLTTADLKQRHLEQFGPDMNAAALSDAGSWFIGGLPHDLYDALMAELNLMRERLMKQILPQFDDMILPRLEDGSFQVTMRNGEVTLVEETSEEVRRSLDEFMGFNVDDAYLEKNWIETTNPNYGKPVTWEAKKRYAYDEIQRRSGSVDTYAELHMAIDDSRDWEKWATQRKGEINADVELAWDLQPGGAKWMDNRPKIRAPKHTVLLQASKFGPAPNQLATMIDTFLSFDRVPRTTFLKRIHADKTNDILDMLEAKGVPLEDWEQYADTGQRLEALQALVESEALPKAYMSESLLWYGLREHQSRRYRTLYYATVGALGLWKTATLPMRPAFVVRNVADNFSKMMLSGFRDPRLFYAMTADGTKSVFQMAAFRPMKGLAGFIDKLHPGANVRYHLEEFEREFWSQHPSTLEKIMEAEGIPVHPSMFRKSMGEEEMSDPEFRGSLERVTEKNENLVTEDGEPKPPKFETLRTGSKGGDVTRIITRHDIPQDHWVARFRDAFWEMAVATPEGYMSKQLYVARFNEEMAKAEELARRSGDTEFSRLAYQEEAQKRAIKTVADTLFDYDNVSVLEENLKVFFPFIFFWRSNAQFWAKAVVDKPWFFYKADQVYEAHLESNIDQPEWMRRYVDLSPIGNTLDNVPGLSWVGNWLSSGVSTDPLNYISIAAFYRAYKSGNQDLPADQQGWAFIANLVDGFNADAGLSINPFMRFLGERFGILNYRTWQDIFPQTSLLTALSNTDFIRGLLPIGPAGFDIEHYIGDKIFHDMLGGASTQEMTIQNFNYYVQREMAAQVARGETPNRAEAEKKIRGFLAFQAIVGYSIGTFPRRMTADDIAIDKIAEYVHQIYADPDATDAEKSASYQSFMASQSEDMRAAYQLYQKNKAQDKVGLYNPAAFDRWAMGAAGAQAFFAIEDPEEQQAFLEAHPEILPIINPVIDDRVPSSTYIRDLTLINDTQAAVDFGYIYLDDIEADYSARKAAESVLVSPEMRTFWAANDTPGEIRARQIAGSYFHYISRLSNTYFAIPDNHYQARTEYLSKHPELADWWARNDGASDDYRAIQLAANSTFREIYFKMVDQGDWDAADIFLKRHSYMFDYTSAEGRITPDGNWLPRSQAQKDYAAVAEDLKVYYSYGSSSMAESYLLAHPNVRAFLSKYKGVGGMQDYAADYDNMKSLNDTYFSLPESQKASFLAAHPELKAYWNKYAHERSDSQHARDYLAVKSLLDAFFDLDDSAKSAYLSAHPQLQAYFDKYGSHKAHGSIRSAIAASPEIKQRYDFWQAYFALPPNKRAQFVYTHAEAAGIFVYGSLAGNWRHDIESEWNRKAIRFGTSKRAAAYMSIKPLMDMYFSIDSDGEKALFLQTNPELQVYFEMFGDPFTNDPKMNRLLKQYFRFPGFSPQRAAFIDAHPEIRAFFNKDASPKERAIQRQADAYFSLPFQKRDEYLKRHPELQDYFDQRSHEADLFASLTEAFNETDPRMKKYYEMYSDIIPKDAIHRYFLMLQRVDEIIQGPTREQGGRRVDDGTLRRRTRNPVQ